ncbi:ABC transporter substrate-binding protein [Tsukamurella sp. 8F]|uniref:ABC transporter substrate-binding protein n=1 Tax=unclassified Tsukamurella TaxID=2633480 RepID=UPI0023B91D3E|nr:MULTISPECIES: ABC transporter substrate-binding protein [unclassified Tsukamurella]MDF0532471.1 ABC transporter substrate-binding protein [Tsukamurella sp. 8J]MDF0589328.1 ABC transporter substrate-binding protein [Tsukamurella sp. 8F]
MRVTGSISNRTSSQVAVAILALILAMVASGCTGRPESRPSGGATHRSVQTDYGAVVIPGAINRVVALSSDWLGTMLAVHAPVVGYRTDGPAVAMAAAPWLGAALPGGAVRLTGRLDIERIAALRPDLIVGPEWLVGRGEYDRLSALAPTIIDDDSGAGTSSGSWERQLATAGKALDRDVGPIRTRLYSRIRDTARRHPQIAGRTFALAAAAGTQVAVTSSGDASAAKFLGSLGMHLVDIPGAAGRLRTVISPENRRTLDDAYLLIIGAAGAPAGALGTFTAQRPANSPTLVADLPLLNAFNIPDASSIPILLDRLDTVLPTGG